MNRDLLFDDRLTSYGRLVEAHRRLDDRFATTLQQRHSISVTWFETMLRIGRSPDRRLMMKDLAAQVALTTGAITRIVDCLSREGLVRRVADPEDRRVQQIELTPDGAERLEAAIRDHLRDLDTELFDRFDDGERRRFDTLLDKLRD